MLNCDEDTTDEDSEDDKEVEVHEGEPVNVTVDTDADLPHRPTQKGIEQFSTLFSADYIIVLNFTQNLSEMIVAVDWLLVDLPKAKLCVHLSTLIFG